jgi:tRNA pseudouridine synthase 9
MKHALETNDLNTSLKKMKSEPPKYLQKGDGYRRVEPYDYTYETFAKGRWIGQSIASVFKAEFRDRSWEYYQRAIEEHRIRVNFKPTTADYIIDHHDVIQHFIHRHEPPVLDLAIDIVYEDDNMLIVNKPPSIPVHPSGRYTHNSLLNILKYEMGYSNDLCLVNRIDRLTSGLVLLAKNKRTAQLKMREMMDRNIDKAYIARVRGDFKWDEIECNEPMLVYAHKLGILVMIKV